MSFPGQTILFCQGHPISLFPLNFNSNARLDVIILPVLLLDETIVIISLLILLTDFSVPISFLKVSFQVISLLVSILTLIQNLKKSVIPTK
jgi:hypothetical protein